MILANQCLKRNSFTISSSAVSSCRFCTVLFEQQVDDFADELGCGTIQAVGQRFERLPLLFANPYSCLDLLRPRHGSQLTIIFWLWKASNHLSVTRPSGSRSTI